MQYSNKTKREQQSGDSSCILPLSSSVRYVTTLHVSNTAGRVVSLSDNYQYPLPVGSFIALRYHTAVAKQRQKPTLQLSGEPKTPY